MPFQISLNSPTLHVFNVFHSLPQTYKTLFWDLFGYGDVSDVDVVVGNVNVTQYLNDTTKTVLAQGPLVKHTLTEWVGFGLYGTYHMFVIIVLLNMLIAMMANSYNVVEVGDCFLSKNINIK